MVRRHPWQALVAVALLQVAAACPEIGLPTGGGNTPTVTAPSSLTATAASATQINLAWTDNSTNEDGFRIERAPGGTTTFAEIATVAAGVTTYQNTGLTGATQYAYRVRAYNAAATSEYSATATTTTLLAAPTAPSNLLASGVSSTQVNLVWTDNSTNEDGFKIERSTTGTTGLVEVATVGAGVTTFENTGLTASTAYTYRVRSYNTAGNSAYTNTAVGFTSAVPVTPPAAPSGLTAAAASTSTINLGWTDNSSDETGFHVERAPGTTSSFSVIATLNAGVVTYQSAGLTASTQYTYRVRAFNTAGNSSYTATATATTLGGTSPPAAPSNLAASAASSTQINLSWNDNSSDEDGFKIERAPGGTGTFTEITTVAAGVTTYQNTGLTASTQYTYRARAYNGAGNSSYSATATATTNPSAGTPPTTPSGLGATAASSTQINLTWTDNSNDEDGFRIERAPGITSSFVEIGTVGAGVTAYPSTGLTVSTQYTYRVRAYNLAGNSAYSGTATATTSAAVSPPAAPTNLQTVIVDATQMGLTWVHPSTDEDGFKIERSPDNVNFTQIGTSGAGTDIYNDNGLTASTTYYYRVRAYNAGGNSAYSNTATGTTTPNPPSALTATPFSSTQINLSWTDNSPDETGFRIDRAPGGGGPFVQVGLVGSGVVTYQNTGLTASTSYTYKVYAYNTGGFSLASNAVTVSTPAAPAPPAAPSGLGATAASSTQINLSWVDNSSNEDGFRIERAPGSNPTNFAEITTVAANATTYQNTGLTASTSYVYRVRAYNGAGNSAYTSTATTSTLAAPPAAPSGLTAVAASDVQITLTWVDNSTTETGFTIEQAPGGTSNYTLLANVPAGTTTVNNTGLPSGTTYHYRVKATNAAGSSAYSNTATATTWLVMLATADNLLMQASVNGGETNERYTNYPSGEFSVGCNQPAGSSGQFCTMTALQFTGLQPLIAGKAIASAYLRVYPYNLAVERSGTHAVDAFVATWTSTGVSGITWDNEPNVWLDTQSELPAPQAYGAMDFNVTTIAQNWASGARTNAGLLVRDTQSWSLGTLRQTYYNGLDTYAGAQYRPLLIIIFQ